MKAVFLDYGSVSHDDLDDGALRQIMPDLIFHESSDDREARERIADAAIVLLNQVRITRSHIEPATALKLIALTATGTNNIDLAAARERGIAVCNIRGYCTGSVVQHVWSMALSLTQHLNAYAQFSSDGHWQRGARAGKNLPPIRELAGKTLGIIGWGELGRAVARVGESFGMRVAIAQRPGAGDDGAGRMSLAQLLREADIVSLHCPLTPANRGMIGAAELALMKPGALLINTARGALVDSGALAAALRAGRIGGAGIDVLAQEPPADADPLLAPGIPNLFVTPHIAWSAREARQRSLNELAENVRDYLQGGRRGRVV